MELGYFRGHPNLIFCITCRVLDNSLVGGLLGAFVVSFCVGGAVRDAAFGFCLFVLFFRGSQLSHMLYMAGAIFDDL